MYIYTICTFKLYIYIYMCVCVYIYIYIYVYIYIYMYIYIICTFKHDTRSPTSACGITQVRRAARGHCHTTTHGGFHIIYNLIYNLIMNSSVYCTYLISASTPQ